MWISNSAIPFLENINLPLINLVNFFFLLKLFLIFAFIGWAPLIPNEDYKNGNTKNLKQAAEEIGFPGNPKKALLFINFANISGLPGRI